MRSPRTIRTLYDADYFERANAHSLESARVVVPIVVEVVSPRSVVDVGCGNGSWLCAFRENGVRDVHGYDGAASDSLRLLIPVECFSELDLEDLVAPVAGKFDLAVSLEVAEHLSAAAGDILVERLTRLAPLVLFSAAVPGQGGIGHVSEQWPAYWIERFRACGYAAYDSIRQRIFFDSRVEWFYRQNMLLFASADYPHRNRLIPFDIRETDREMIEWINREMAMRQPTLRQSVLNIFPATRRSVSYHARRLF